MNQVLETLKANKERLFSKYPLKSMALFGSYSRGDNNNLSDVDVMVGLSAPDAIAFINLGYEPEDIFQKKVDVVLKNGLMERYMRAIDDVVLLEDMDECIEKTNRYLFENEPCV